MAYTLDLRLGLRLSLRLSLSPKPKPKPRPHPTQARRLLWLAAEQGQTDAQILCAHMLYRGEGGGVDMEAAFRLYSMAVEADPPEPDAHHALGCMYYNGEGEGGRGPPTPERFARARQLLGTAASENHHEAQTPNPDPNPNPNPHPNLDPNPNPNQVSYCVVLCPNRELCDEQRLQAEASA